MFWKAPVIWKNARGQTPDDLENTRKIPARAMEAGRGKRQALPLLDQIGRALKERDSGADMEKTAGQQTVSGWPVTGCVQASLTALSWW